VSEAKLDKIRAQAVELGAVDENFIRVLSQVPGYTEALFDSLTRSHVDGAVDHKLKEIIRIMLARQAGDAYFGTLRSKPAAAAGLTEEMIEAGCGDFEADARFSAPEKWALRYAKLMYTKPKSVDTAFYAEGKSHYSEAEIMEIGTFIAFHYGMQVFTRAIGLKVAG
jgi:alkylhydroperoxidase family enzyme